MNLKPLNDTKTKVVTAVTLAPALLFTQAASASEAPDISAIAAGLTAQIDGAQTAITALFTAGLVILGLFLGFRYLKRGANAA